MWGRIRGGAQAQWQAWTRDPRPADWQALILVSVGAAALILSRYHCDIGTYFRHFRGDLKSWATYPVHDHLYWFWSSFVALGLLPLATVALLPGERLRDYGLGLGDWRPGLKAVGLLFALMAGPVLWAALGDSLGFKGFYPLDRDALRSWPLFLIYELGYLSYFVAWEFFFRGFLLFGLHKRIGQHAIWVQLLPFALLHVGKPELEALGSIFAGVALALLALRTRSFWWCALLHAGIAGTMDLLSALGRIKG